MHLALWVLLVRARAGEAAAVLAVVAARGELGGDNMELQTEEKVEDEMEKRARGAVR